MQIEVRVNAKAKHEEVRVFADGALKVAVSVPPVDGKANKRVIELLAEYFDVPKSRVTITHGARNAFKRVTIEDTL